MNRLPLLATLLLFYAISPLPAAEKPNVVMIISDDQAWTDYGFMGHEAIETPNLDRLAAESVTFTRGYVPSSLCRPSLATLISGLYPHQHKIVGNDERPHGKQRPPRERLIRSIDEVPTLPKLLGEHGYLSHQSGKWWEGNHRRGGFTHGMTHGDTQRGGRHGDVGLKIGREGLEPIFDFIAEARAADKPFLLWYAPFLPHTPHTPPERLFNKYKDKTPSIHVARYWAMCEWFDETCGELLKHLDEQGLRENTLVVYVCDNGWIQQPDERGFAPRSKRSQYDGGIRTPILLRWPNQLSPAKIETPVSSIDLAPTILAACGLEPTADMPGVNLADRQAIENRQAIFGEIYEHDVEELGNPAASLRHRWVIEHPWKLIVPHPPRESGPVELFNLADDPHEERNLAEKHPERVNALKQKLNRWWSP